MAADGKFPEEWAARMQVTRRTVRNWRKLHPDFREATALAQVMLEAYWSRAIREALTTAHGTQPAALLDILCKRFPHLWGGNGQVDQLTPPPGTLIDMDDASCPFAAAELSRITDEQLNSRIDLLLARRACGVAAASSP